MAQVIARAVNRNLMRWECTRAKNDRRTTKRRSGSRPFEPGHRGEHTVLFAGKGERIEITHRAHSRPTRSPPARSAPRSGSWQDSRVFTNMQDVLGLK